MKTTWQDVFESFKRKYPRLSTSVADYKPYDFMSIEIVMQSGERLVYSGFNEQAKMIA